MTWIDDNAQWLARAREHWAPKNPEPLTLRAWLAQPVLFDSYDPLTVEGALQSTVCMLETGMMPDDVFSTCPFDAPLDKTDIQIPIHDRVVEMSTGYLPLAESSCGVFSPDAALTWRYKRKRARAESYRIDKVEVSKADFKSTNDQKATVTALWVDFHMVADRHKVEALLPDVPTIGSSRSFCMGSVMGFEIIPWNGGGFVGENGELLRSIPTECRNQFGAINMHTADPRMATLRAPYWHRRTLAPCLVPIQRIGES